MSMRFDSGHLCEWAGDRFVGWEGYFGMCDGVRCVEGVYITGDPMGCGCVEGMHGGGV